MRVYYVNSAGQVRVDEIKPSTKLIEYPDGLHFISKNAIRRNLRDKRISSTIIWQDVTPAEGGAVSVQALVDVEVAKQNRQRVAISRMWYRGAKRFFTWFGRTLWFCIFLAWIAVGLYVFYAVVNYYGI